VARLSFPTERQVQCPLLIDAAQLEALDAIIDHHTGPLSALKERELEDVTSRELQRRLTRGFLKEDQLEAQKPRVREFTRSTKFDKDGRSVRLYLSRGREIQAQRFSEAVSQPIGEQETPLGFALFFRIGNVRARAILVDSWRQELSLEVEPNDNEAAQELFGALSNWASDIEAPKWQQKWVAIRDYIVPIVFFWVVLGLIFVPVLNWEGAGRRANEAEVRKLLAQGITPSNQQRAFNLLLAIESNYDSGGTGASLVGVRYWSYFGIGALILVMALIAPHVSIGVWGGKHQLRRWRWWLKTVTVTIPVLLVGSLILPWILHLLGLSPPN
jgi:hypothetical protein